ncbi:MAG: hypothetical protein QOG71_809 [Pyrinomonadaceae bacterium]|nr:hypothetical protein [Pyrinomonadaceae bacterium]
MPKIIATKAANKTMIRKCLTSSSRQRRRTHPACSNNSGVPRPSKIGRHIPMLPVANDPSRLCWRADWKGRVTQSPDHKSQKHKPESPYLLRCVNRINARLRANRQDTLPRQPRLITARAPDGLGRSDPHLESPKPKRRPARPPHQVFPSEFLSLPKSAPSLHNSS